jgi:prepilin-type N-terminal cleavage/methylation domain-containing protein
LSRRAWLSGIGAAGFTLIEVIGALVIFSVGVLMVVQVSGALGARMRQAGQRSALVVFANQQLDSLEAEPFASLVAGTVVDTFRVEGVDFASRATVTTITEVLKRIEISVQPLAGAGPTYAVTSYSSAVW